MTKPLVSIIVSNLNGMKLHLLDDCLNSLMHPSYSNWELLVVDNASTDSSVSFVKRKFKNHKNCKVILNPINMYSQGLNLGAKHANGKYLAYFNNDVAITKGYFNELIGKLEKNTNVSIGQGKLINYSDHTKIDSAGETMDRFGNPVTIGFGETDKKQFDRVEEILSASGSACIIRKDVFEKLGGYDPIYGIGYEDMDLALRMRRMGYKIMRFPKAIVYHKRAQTDLAKFVRVQVKWHFNKNRLVTMIKNYPTKLLIQSLPVTLLIYLTIASYECLIRRNYIIGWKRISAMGWVAINLEMIFKKRSSITLTTKSKELSASSLSLFSSKPLVQLSRDFVAK